MKFLLIFLLGLVVLVLGLRAQRTLMSRAKRKELPRSALDESVPLSEAGRTAIGVLMILMLIAPVFLLLFLYPVERAMDLTPRLAPDGAVVVPTAGFWIAIFTSIVAMLVLGSLVVGLVFSLLPLNMRRQLGDTPVSVRSLTIGYSSAFAVCGILVTAGFQSYVGFAHQGIVRNGFFEYRDHLTPYRDIKAVTIGCRSRDEKGHTVLRITMSAQTNEGETIHLLKDFDGEDLRLGVDESGPAKTTLQPAGIQKMHRILSDTGIQVHSTICSRDHIGQMTAGQRGYFKALLPDMFR